MSNTELEQLFQQGVAAIRAGDKARARDLLTQVVEQNQMHEQAWLWLSAAVADKEEQIVCLQNVLTINPSSEIAQRGLRKLGALPEPPPEPEPKPELVPGKPASASDDTWRSKLDDPGYVSGATIVKPMHEPPKLGVLDLANAWAWAIIFQVAGPYEEHVEYGPAGHIFVSLIVAILLQLFGVGAVVALALTQTLSLGSATGRFTENMPDSTRADFQKLFSSGGLSLGAGEAGMLVTVALVTFVIFAIVTLVALIFQSIVVNRVAQWLGGKGSIIPMTQALAIALVPSQLIGVPTMIAWLLIPGIAGSVILIGASLYQFLQTANAVNAAHRLGIFASMGAVIISGFAMGLIGCCLSFGTTFLFGGGAR